MNRLTHRLLPLLAVLPAGCFGISHMTEAVAVYPSDLQPPIASILAWPADPEGTGFRFVFQDSYGRIDDSVPPRETDVESDEVLGATLPPDVGAVMVLVPVTAGPELRAAARALLARVEEDHLDLTTSVVVTPVELAHVEDAASLSRALDEARAQHRRERPRSFSDSLWMEVFRPRWVVMPAEADAEQFIAIGDLSIALEHGDPALAEETLFDEQGLLEHLAAHREARGWEFLPVAVLVPHGSDAARCDALAARLQAEDRNFEMLLRAPVDDPYSPGRTRELLVRALQRNDSLDALFKGRVTVRFAYDPRR